MSDEENKKETGGAVDKAEGETAEPAHKIPSLFRNYISFMGAVVVVASLTSILLLFLIDITGGAKDNPYLGILTYVILPAFLILGLLIILTGMLIERRRRRRLSPAEIAAYPVLDLNDPHRRRTFLAFIGITFIFIFMSAFGSYHAYEYTESVTFCGQSCHTVMEPEFSTFKVAPHSRLRCVDCHVGAGPEWYVRSKFSGVRQLYAVTFNTYSRPIKTPVHNMRPANETCSQCHWPEKYYGNQLKVFNRYGNDQNNTLRQTRMLMHVGGGSPATGLVSGIHWHMNLANEVTYIATDEQRQVIPWVRVKDMQGNVTEYRSKNALLTPEQITSAQKRRMDCIDCHNRPTHNFIPPDQAINSAFDAGRLDVSLPFLKQQALTVLTKQYSTREEARNEIATGLDQFYRTNYSDVYSQKGDAIKRAVGEIQRIYQTYFFPEMKTDWRSHPDNIGHYYSQGCFRCHDGQHVSNTGKVIRNECNICHTVMDETEGGMPVAVQNGSYRHPIDLGNLSALQCTACHGGKAFIQHPVNLGDISAFKCVDCHAGKVWGMSGN